MSNNTRSAGNCQNCGHYSDNLRPRFNSEGYIILMCLGCRKKKMNGG